MRVLILGAGVVGVTAAYELARRGHQVAIIDRGKVAGAETSFANGGQLSYSTAEPWANPGVWPKLPVWVVDPSAPLVLRPRLDADMIRWGLKFLRNCTSARAHEHGAALVRLGLYSRLKMADFVAAAGAERFDYQQKGILHIYSTEKEWRAGIAQAEFQARFGGEEQILAASECVSIEPALADGGRKIAGGVLAHQDETGDAYHFTQALLDVCVQKLGVVYHGDTHIESIGTHENNVTRVATSKGYIDADVYMMALGAYSAPFLKMLGLRVPIYPLKGYSATVPWNEHSPRSSITDVSAKVVYTKLGDRLRIAGTAEFAGFNQSINPKRLKPILKSAKKLFPQAEWNGKPEQWGCLRSSTPDGLPILGFTPYRNLLLNTGHGTLGWTQAAGCAHILADIIDGHAPQIMLHGLTLERFI